MRNLPSIMLVAILALAALASATTQTTYLVTNAGAFSGTVNACGSTNCPTGQERTQNWHWIRNPASQITSFTISFTPGGTTCESGSGVGCGFRMWLCDDSVVVPIEGAGTPNSCSATNGAYMQFKAISNGALANNVMTATCAEAFRTGTFATLTSTGVFRTTHSLAVVLDYSAKTVSCALDGGAPVVSTAGTGTPSGSGFVFVEGLNVGTPSGSTKSDTSVAYGGTLVGVQAATTPLPPAGLAATVTQAWASSTVPCLIALTWPVSATDPDQVGAGSYTYSVYAQGVLVGTDPTTSQDGDGTRYNTLSFGTGLGSSPGNVAIYVTATDATTGEVSTHSLTATVNCSLLGSSQAVGNVNPGTVAGTVSPTTGDVGTGIVAFAASIGFQSTGSLFFFGLLLVAVAILAVAGPYAAVTRSSSPVPGAIAAVGMMLFNVFSGVWEQWAGIVLIILAAAIVVLGGRSLFTGASGGGQGG